MGLAAVAAISVSSALIWGLYQGQKKSTGGTELYNTENKPAPEGLTTLPRDYTRLGDGGSERRVRIVRTDRGLFW